MSLLHLSISADDPELVASFLAKLLGGRALSFPPFPDSWIAFSAQDDGTAIEVYPTTHVLTAGTDHISCEIKARSHGFTFVHAAIGSPLESADILEMAKAENWLARTCHRGPFACVEIWLENRLLVEVLDPQMQQDYRCGMTASNWSSMFGLA